MANVNLAAAPDKIKGDKKKKGKVGLIILLVLILLLAGGVFITVFNVFGFRDDVVFPLLRDIPLVGGLVPDADATQEVDLANVISNLEYEIVGLDEENALLNAQLDSLNSIIQQNNLEIARLREFETAHSEFVYNQAEFFRELAEGDPEAYMNIFETMNPVLAEELYLELRGLQIDIDEWQNYLATWDAMSANQVAQVIESMLTTDMPLIVRVMLELPEGFRGSILNLMEPDNAGAVLRQMYP